jgi:hypothetical protein
MSSKEQFRQTLKGDRKIIADLKTERNTLLKKINLQEKVIDELRLRIKLLQIELKRKHQWWKFWK